MLRSRLLLLSALLLAACDNVGRAFDPVVDPNNPSNEGGESAIQVVPVGGDVRDGRPLVRAVYPEGAGWPTTVPVVVEFSESVNEASLLPTSPNGVDGRIGVRIQGTGQLLPAQYDLLGGGKLLVIRPLTPLTNEGVPIYEVVLFEDARDVDGLRFQVSGGETVLADFQVNQGESIEDGAVLAVFPRDNSTEHPRENDVLVVFDKPANPGALVAANLSIQPAGGAAVDADLSTPLSLVGVPDPRVVRLSPAAALASSQRYELVVTQDITFGQSGNLAFNGTGPFSVFDTVAPARPTQVRLGNALPNFDNRVNSANIADVVLEVALPGDAAAGDVVVARIYGGDAATAATFDEAFFERTATVPAGATEVSVDFAGVLGAAASPTLDEGDLTFAAQLRRGADRSGFAHSDASARPALDVTPPTLVSLGPPNSGGDVLADGEFVALYGVASEELSDATLVADTGATARLFGSSGGGRFLMEPLELGRSGAPRSFTLGVTDASGNAVATPATGQVLTRGVVTGALAGTLRVRAFDRATLLPVPDATVLVDPATPSAPAAGQLLGTTDQDGLAEFASALAAHTVTIVHPDFDVVTLVDTQAAEVSLPLTPSTAATATVTGNVFFEPAAGVTALVGSTAVAGGGVLGVQTDAASAGAIPAFEVLPNRPQVLTGFGGGFEPTAAPAYALSGCQVLGPAFVAPTAPPAPSEPGGATNVTFALLPVPPVISPNPATDPSLSVPYALDFGLATGLDTSDLVGGGPRVRCATSLLGFTGQALTGVGVATASAGAAYDVDVNYSLPILTGLASYAPLAWLVAEAEDSAGRVSRARALIVPAAQVVAPGAPPPLAVPAVAGGTFTGAPLVSFDDVLDAATVIGGAALTDLAILDSTGRRWLVLVPDRDGAGGQSAVQLPDLSASANPGLGAGEWVVTAESRVFLAGSGATVDDFALTERFRQEVNYARSAAATLTVN
ncbi:MAG: Ig-like domain-containing protein [Planctomycetota bacterium]